MIPNLANSYKLITKEDTYNIHKIFGIVSLGNYIYRFYNWNNKLGFQYETKTSILLFCAIHGLLSLTGLLFKLPSKRIKGSPMMWPEFRMHSIIFAFRSLIAMVFITLNMSTPFSRCCIIFGTLISADLSTMYYNNTDNNSTMRGMPYPNWLTPNIKKIMNIFYSYSQVLATLSIMYATQLPELFLILFPIQLAALLLTLVRKGIISTSAWHIYYTLSLSIAYLYSYKNTVVCDSKVIDYISNNNELIQCNDNNIIISGYILYSIFFTYMRFTYKFNKYILWGLISLCYIVYN